MAFLPMSWAVVWSASSPHVSETLQAPAQTPFSMTMSLVAPEQLSPCCLWRHPSRFGGTHPVLRCVVASHSLCLLQLDKKLLEGWGCTSGILVSLAAASMCQMLSKWLRSELPLSGPRYLNVKQEDVVQSSSKASPMSDDDREFERPCTVNPQKKARAV